MGVRLYPVEVSDSVLEVLAGVPEGTAERLKTLETLRPTMSDKDWYDRLYANSDLHTLDSFKTFGWGKLTDSAYDFIHTNGWDENIGSASGINAHMLLCKQGVSIPENIKFFDVSWS
jgi:hypothetical protein